MSWNHWQMPVDINGQAKIRSNIGIDCIMGSAWMSIMPTESIDAASECEVFEGV